MSPPRAAAAGPLPILLPASVKGCAATAAAATATSYGAAKAAAGAAPAGGGAHGGGPSTLAAKQSPSAARRGVRLSNGETGADCGALPSSAVSPLIEAITSNERGDCSLLRGAEMSLAQLGNPREALLQVAAASLPLFPSPPVHTYFTPDRSVSPCPPVTRSLVPLPSHSQLHRLVDTLAAQLRERATVASRYEQSRFEAGGGGGGGGAGAAGSAAGGAEGGAEGGEPTTTDCEASAVERASSLPLFPSALSPTMLPTAHGGGARSPLAAPFGALAHEAAEPPRMPANDETPLLHYGRWAKLKREFYKPKKGQFDTTKIPDLYDNATYDMLHNQHLGLQARFLRSSS